MPHNSGSLEAPSEHSQPLHAPRAGGVPVQDIPPFGFDTPIWRAACRNGAEIPAGYTYLSQLMGHDLGHTVPASTLPWTAHHAGEAQPNQRYNLIENPLTLETIYGKGPIGNAALYHAGNGLFRLDKSALQASKIRYSDYEPPEPLLADMRNRDTLMLHKLAVIWMQYHNKIAREIMAAEGFDEHSHAARAYFISVFTRARKIVLRAWHRVLMQDVLPTLAHPAAMALSKAELGTVFLLEDIPALNGIMRAFHALPLAQYRLNSGQTSPFGQLRAGAVGELRNWRIDWALFFGPEAQNFTGFSASYSRLFTIKSGRSIMHADLNSAIIALPYAALHAEVMAAYAALPATLKRAISAEALAESFNARAADAGMPSLPAGAFKQIPLFLLLMLEAQFYGKNSGLGPFGSALLRRYLSHKIASIHIAPDPDSSAFSAPVHTTIMEIINYV